MEGDVELPGQVVELAVVQDELPQLEGQGQRFQPLGRIEPAGRIAGQVADVVGSGAPGVQADGLDPPQEFRRILETDMPELQVGPRGDLQVTGGEAVGHRGDLTQLGRGQLAARDAESGHVPLLHRAHGEEPLPFEAERVVRVGGLIGGRVLQQQRVGVQRVEFPLDAFLIGQLGQIRSRRRSRRGRNRARRHEVAEAETAIAEACEEALEVGGLLGIERLTGDLLEREAHGMGFIGIERLQYTSFW